MRPFTIFFICSFITLPFGRWSGMCSATDPIPVAHRGVLRHAPENTLAGFAVCLDLGMGFELDIRTTKDGYLVVLHDDDVKRTTNSPSRSVRDLTLKELRTLDAGSWFDEAFSDARIPTLDEVLSLVAERKRGQTIIALNVKQLTPKGEQKLVALVEKHKLLNESFAFDQSDEVSRRLKALNPAFRIGQNVNRKSINVRLDEGLIDCFLLTSTPTKEEVSRLHESGKQVLFNFAGESEARRNKDIWKRAAQAGIDGLLTDYPLECRAAWREKIATPPSLDPRGIWVETPWGKPVIDRGLKGAWDHMAVDNPYVHQEGETIYCFYEAQDKPFAERGSEAIGIAISKDGVSWKKLPSNPILHPGPKDAWDHVVSKLPAGLIRHRGIYHLFYSGRDQRTKQIGIATAANLLGPWTKSQGNPVFESNAVNWDKHLSTHPTPVFEIDGRFHLLYRGMQKRYANQGVGIAVSTDLLHWERLSNTPVINVRQEIASMAVAETNTGFVGISQPMNLANRTYWYSNDLHQWHQGPPVNFRSSVRAETISNPFLSDGKWTVLYEQNDRIYRAILQPSANAIQN